MRDEYRNGFIHIGRTGDKNLNGLVEHIRVTDAMEIVWAGAFCGVDMFVTSKNAHNGQ